MGLGLGLGCCCCVWLDDAFQRAATSGSAGNRLGPNWNVLSGDWQIVDNVTLPSGYTYGVGTEIGQVLVASAAGSQLACLRNPDSPANYTLAGYWLASPHDIMPPDGAVLRCYLLSGSTPGAAYIEWKTGPGGYVTLVGDTTYTTSSGSVLGTGTLPGFYFCVAQTLATQYTISVVGIAGATVEVSSPPGSGFILEVVSTPSPIVMMMPIGPGSPVMLGTNINATCPGPCACCPTCPTGTQFSVLLSGVANGSCAHCAYYNATFLVGYEGGCAWSTTFTLPATGDRCDPYTLMIAIVLEYDASTNRTQITVTITAGSSGTGGLNYSFYVYRPGKPDCAASNWGTIRNTDDDVTVFSPDWSLACDFTDFVVAITSLYSP